MFRLYFVSSPAHGISRDLARVAYDAEFDCNECMRQRCLLKRRCRHRTGLEGVRALQAACLVGSDAKLFGKFVGRRLPDWESAVIAMSALGYEGEMTSAIECVGHEWFHQKYK